MLRHRRGERNQWVVPLLIPAVLAVFLVAALTLGRSSAGGVEDARSFLDRIAPFEAQEGDVVYTRTESYQRFGPKADVIIRDSGLVSERSTAEYWVQVGPNETVTHRLTRRSDDSGVVYYESIRTPELSRAIDPRTGDVLAEGPGQVTDAVDTAANNVAGMRARLDSGDTRVVEVTETTLTLETALPDAAFGDWFDDEESFSVPFHADLEATEGIQRVTIRSDGVFTSSESIVTASDGRQVTMVASSECCKRGGVTSIVL